jgi:hypothetical protein
MNAFNNLLTPAQEARLRALDAWHRVLENNWFGKATKWIGWVS